MNKKLLTSLLVFPLLLSACGGNTSISSEADSSEPQVSSISSEQLSSSEESLPPSEEGYELVTKEVFNLKAEEALNTYMDLYTYAPYYTQSHIRGKIDDGGQEKNVDVLYAYTIDDDGNGSWNTDEEDESITGVTDGYFSYFATQFVATYDLFGITEDNLCFYISEDGFKIKGSFTNNMSIASTTTVVDYVFDNFASATYLYSEAKSKMLTQEITNKILFFIEYSVREDEPFSYFKSWNDCEALEALKAYVEDVTNIESENYIPEEDRIATFDMDGTFVGELCPSYFEYNLLEYRGLDDPTYTDKDPFVVETAQNIRDFVRNGTPLPRYNDEYGFDMKHAYAAAKAYAGMTIAEFDAYVKEFAAKPANGFTNMNSDQTFYQPMLEVFDYLYDNNFAYYVVSGSDRFICRALVEALGIPSNRVIGMDVVLKSTNQGEQDGVNYTYSVEDSLVRTDEVLIKNLKTNKVKQIAQEIGKVPVLSFGNSSGDCAMHNYCLQNSEYKTAAFMLVADDNERDHAKKFGESDVDFEVRINKLNNDWTSNNYHVISMKNDFKTIYGDDVIKTDFIFE